MAGPSNTLSEEQSAYNAMKRIDTYLTPFPRNSSAIASPRARISLRLKVEALLIPDGKPVTFLTRRKPAGPSLRQIDGIPRRGTAYVSPTQRPVRESMTLFHYKTVTIREEFS